MKHFSHILIEERRVLLFVFCISILFVLFSPIAFANHTGNPADHASGQGVVARVASSIFGSVLDTIELVIYKIAVAIGGGIAFLGGYLLDVAIKYTILDMGTYFSQSGALGPGIISLWGVIRDILNILFIFGLIYVGIKTILNSDDSSTQRTLGLLIVAALFVNFSLYITQVVTDFTNIAAVQVHNQIVGSGGLGGSATVGDTEFTAGSITAALMNLSGVSSFFGGDTTIDTLSFEKVIFYSIFLMIFLIVAGMVFAMGAFLLIARFIAVLIFMILSPLMFAGFILPALGKYQKEWWSKFLQYSFFAPAFLFMLYLSLFVLQLLKQEMLKGGPQFADIMQKGQPAAGSFTIILFFCLMIGFLYASIKVANSMGVYGAQGSLKALDWMKNSAVGATQGFAYRNTVGWGLNKLTDKIDQANRNEGKGSRMARMGNYGLRMVTGGESGRQSIEKASNAGLGGRGREQVKKDEKARSQRAAQGIQIGSVRDSITPQALNASYGDPARSGMERMVREAPSSQILEMMHDKDDRAKIISVAGELSESQAKAVMDDKEISDAVKADFAKARGEQVSKRLVEINKKGNLSEAIGKADTAELKALGFALMMENDGELAGNLSAKQIEDWKDLTPTEKVQLKAMRKERLEKKFDLAHDGAGAKALFDDFKNDTERSKLPDSILEHKNSAEFLNTNVLAKIVDNDGISEAHRQKIKKNVLEYFRQHPDVVDYEHELHNWRNAMSQYNSIPVAQRNAVLHPGAEPAKNETVKKMEKTEEWFNKNNAGQRY